MIWKKTPLSEISDVVTKGTTPTTLGKNFVDSGIPFLRAQNINGSNVILNHGLLFIDEATNNLLARSQIRANDVLLSIAGSIGRSAVVPKTFPQLNCNQAVAIIRPKSTIVSAHFLKYWLDSDDAQKQIYGAKVTATISNLSLSQIKQLEIPLPPLKDQKRIAAILDKADAIRRKRQQAIKLADDFLRATFLDMFGDPVTNPKGWDDSLIEEIAEIQGGLQLTKKRAGNPVEVPYLRVANVYRDKLNLSEIKTILVTQAELERTKLLKGDILVVEGHGNPQEIGRTSVWDGSIDPCTHQNHLIRVRIMPDIADPIFISAFLNSFGGRRQLLGFGKTTSGLNTISTSNVKNTKILLPPIEKQRKYHGLVDKIHSYLRKLHNKQILNDKLFNSLTQRAFRGEL